MADFDGFEYVPELERMKVMLVLIHQVKATECLQFLEHVDTVGPFVDPTAYRDGMHRLDEQRAVCRAFLAAQRELQKCPSLWQALEAVAASTG